MIKILTRETMLYFRDKVVEKLQDDTIPIQKRIEYIERVLTELAEMLPDKEVLKRATWSEWLREIKKMLEKEQGGKMIDNIREKLIKLLHVSVCDYNYDKCEYSISDEVCIRHLEEMAADHLIANGVMVQEWIPVSEPPPLFCAVSGYCPEQNNIYEVYLNARGEWHFFDKTTAGALLDESITHWAHLPPPPKGE